MTSCGLLVCRSAPPAARASNNNAQTRPPRAEPGRRRWVAGFKFSMRVEVVGALELEAELQENFPSFQNEGCLAAVIRLRNESLLIQQIGHAEADRGV